MLNIIFKFNVKSYIYALTLHRSGLLDVRHNVNLIAQRIRRTHLVQRLTFDLRLLAASDRGQCRSSTAWHLAAIRSLNVRKAFVIDDSVVCNRLEYIFSYREQIQSPNANDSPHFPEVIPRPVQMSTIATLLPLHTRQHLLRRQHHRLFALRQHRKPIGRHRRRRHRPRRTAPSLIAHRRNHAVAPTLGRIEMTRQLVLGPTHQLALLLHLVLRLECAQSQLQTVRKFTTPELRVVACLPADRRATHLVDVVDEIIVHQTQLAITLQIAVLIASALVAVVANGSVELRETLSSMRASGHHQGADFALAVRHIVRAAVARNGPIAEVVTVAKRVCLIQRQTYR